jgi:protein TonB
VKGGKMAKVYKNTSPALNWDEDRYYARSSRLGMVGALLLVITVFIFLPKEFVIAPYSLKGEKEITWEELPPELVDEVEPPPIERPKLPVAATSSEEIEAQTIPSTVLKEVFKKPERTDPPVVPFWKVEKPPVLQYLPQAVYPEIARLAGIEGKVTVEALVDTNGRIINTKILKSSGNSALDQAAIDAAQKAIFTPAKQRDELVRVWVAIPFEFKLTGK